MVIKKKHSKQLKKLRQKKEVERKKHEPDVDFDTSAYVVYNRLELTYPCLSFDLVTDDLGSGPERIGKFPLSMYLIAGAQTPPHVENNYLYVMKVDNIKPLKQEDETVKDDDEESEDEDDTEDPSNLPRLNSVRVAHKGCVNRLRNTKIGGRVLTSTWSDKGKVHIYDLTTPCHAVSDQKSINTYTAQKVDPKPIFTFGGHLTEGFALDWSPIKAGCLATGDCKKNIHIWTMKNQADWNVDQQPLVGHENSVEDIKWAPEDADVLASCSVDKSIRVWDLRESVTSRCVAKVLDSHKSDVNVIDWNRKSKNLVVSGGDDGVVKIWDMRFLMKNDGSVSPVASFDYHKKPITSVEWDPNDDTVMAIASEDDRLTLWDLAVEKDDEVDDVKMETEDKNEKEGDDGSSESSADEDEDLEEEDDAEEDGDMGNEDEGVEYGDLNFKKIPEQMLFLHQGQAEIKELHWHPQLNGLLISTALNGINIFKTISA